MTNNIVPYTVKKIMDIVVSIIFKFWLPFPTHSTYLSSLNAINKSLEYNKSHVHHKKWPSKPGYAEGWKVDVPEHAWVMDTPRIQTTPGQCRGGRGEQTTPWSSPDSHVRHTTYTLVAISPTAASTCPASTFILYVRRELEEQHCTESK